MESLRYHLGLAILATVFVGSTVLVGGSAEVWAQDPEALAPRLEREIAALDRAIAASTSDAALYVRRGSAWFRSGDNDRALRDFDRAVALDARLGPYLWQRGISLYYARRFEECVAQFESHRHVNPNDVENAAWHLLCLARLEGLQAARGRMLPVGPDARSPMAEVDALYRGRGTEAQVLAASRTSASGRFYGELYLGLLAHLEGRDEQSRDHFAKANALEFPHYMGDVARLHEELWSEGGRRSP